MKLGFEYMIFLWLHLSIATIYWYVVLYTYTEEAVKPNIISSHTPKPSSQNILLLYIPVSQHGFSLCSFVSCVILCPCQIIIILMRIN